ncbi:hypothetical protein E7T09_16375 [Deinococcus sp. KSM4-11]|uniref:hypothetical protein n=1 Tax=Deinococcus sp. KSM4-11 TaxID=2568654 RepID=UPI0010A36AD4|nr:hypothetical protein [Deinococcus sp. KSM4-11]THF85528.1 hypothetical protein E7T09_16375 [Deinococcus sp. KSM4-11]
MMEDTTPLGKSVEEIEQESGNLTPDHQDRHQQPVVGVMIPPTGLGGAGGTATGTGMGIPMMPTLGDRPPKDEESKT